MMAAGLQPCDAGAIRRTRTSSAPCGPSSRPWVVAAASLGSGMAFLDAAALNVALPAVQTDLEMGARGAQWVYGAFALVLAAFLLVGGSLGDRHGRRRVFVVGAAIFAAASVWCALSPGPGQLVAARAAQGAGGERSRTMRNAGKDTIKFDIHKRGEAPVEAVNRVDYYFPSSRPFRRKRGGDHQEQQQTADQ